MGLEHTPSSVSTGPGPDGAMRRPRPPHAVATEPTAAAGAPQSVDGAAPIRRAAAPASGISIPRHMGVGSDLVHALDYVVLIQVMFNLASGTQPTPLTVWEQLKARGIRSAKNARQLVGRNAVYESFGRLLQAGYLRRQQAPHPTLPGRMGPVVYEVYDNPAWNPDCRRADHDHVEPQAATPPGTPDPSFREPGKPAAHDASRNTGSVVRGSVVPGSGKRRVPAGQDASAVPGSGMASPPHPPVGGGNTTPSPHHGAGGRKGGRAARWEAACALHPEDYVPTEEEVRQAAAFLQGLPGKWQMSLDQARDLAPLLASRAHTLGLELDFLLEIELMAEDPKDPVRVPSRVMPTRIRALRRRSPAAPGGQASGGLAQWCGQCNRGEPPTAAFQRTVELADGSEKPCTKCHPKHTRAARN